MSTAQPVVSFLKESDLIQRAASTKSLTLKNKPRELTSYPEFDSGFVGAFALDKDFLSALEKHGFTFEPGKKPPHDTMRYLTGNSDQKGAEIFKSDSWAWKRTETDHQLTIYFRLSVSERKRGVVCKPCVSGNWDGGACHQPTIDRFVKVVAEHFPDAHPLVRGVKTNTDFRPVIFWSDIGLGGIKSVGWLFDELCGKNEKVIELAHSNLSPFDPSPHSKWEVRDRLFVEEAHQFALFQQWKEQLQAFRDSFA